MKEALAGFSGVDLSQLANTLAHYSATTAETKASISTTKALKALYQLYILATTQLPQLVEAMESFDVEGSELLQQFKMQASQLLAELARCQGLVETVLDLDLAPREYLLKPEYSEELQGMYQEIQELQQQVDQELVEMQERWEQASNDATPVRLETCAVQNNDGSSTSSWQFRLPNTNASKILTPMSGIKLHRVLKNGVYFSTTTLRGLSANHQQLTEEYSKHSQQVVQDAMEVAVTYQIVVERACQMVATLDVLTALARVAAYNPHGYCKPTLTDSDTIGHGIEVSTGSVYC
jgi:DNA mismatch repair protein MSH2